MIRRFVWAAVSAVMLVWTVWRFDGTLELLGAVNWAFLLGAHLVGALALLGEEVRR